MIGVLIVDDHVMFREGLKTLLATAPEFALVGEAGSAEDALERVAEVHPELVLMDIRLPGMSGVEAVQRMVDVDASIRVLMVTMFDDDPSIVAAMGAGALGYILKGADHEELLRAMRAVARGQAIFGPAIARRLMHLFAGLTPGTAPVFSELTAREHDVLALVAQGLSNSEMARRLQVRPKTLRNHVSNIVSKLQVKDRAEAAARARDRGM